MLVCSPLLGSRSQRRPRTRISVGRAGVSVAAVLMTLPSGGPTSPKGYCAPQWCRHITQVVHLVVRVIVTQTS